MSFTSLLFYVAALGLAVRSLGLLWRRDTSPAWRAFSGATLIAVFLAVLMHSSIGLGMVVISPEFGVAMVQGGWPARWGLGAVLVGMGVSAGLSWQATRLHVGRRHRGWLIVAVGLAVGLAAAWTVGPVRRTEIDALRIYYYDLWWPPLQLWLGVCALATVFAERKLASPPARVTFTVTLIAVFATLPLLRPPLQEQATAEQWRELASVAWPLAWALAGLLATPLSLARSRRWGGVGRWTLALAGALGGLFMCWHYWFEPPAGLENWPLWAPALVLVWPLALIGFRWRAVCHALAGEWNRLSWRDAAVLASVMLIAASFASLFYVATLTAGVALTLFLLAWMALAEMLYARAAAPQPASASGSPIQAAPGSLPGMVRLPWRAAFGGLLGGLDAAAARTREMLASVFSAPSVAVALLKVLIGVLLLVALSEITNAGRTVILSFQSPEVDPFKGSGQALADHVVASMARLNDELAPDLIVLAQLKPKDARSSSVSAQGSGSLDAALKKDIDFEVGGVKIPLGLLVAPVQAPMRSLLGVRVVTGSVHLNSGTHNLLATSSAGESWQVGVAAPADGFKAADVYRLMADELAFYIRRDDARLENPGMTRSWEAFTAFRDGLRHWRLYELTYNYAELEPAAAGFRKAIGIDPAFALAHYRLGLVMQADGQPSKAVEAFRASLRASPGFQPANTALAATLWDFESFLFNEVVSVESGAPDESGARTAQNVRWIEARAIWQRQVRAPESDFGALDRAAANYGLCALSSFGLDRHFNGPFESFFYCKRSEELYRRLPDFRRADPQVQRGLGWVLSALGALMQNADRSPKPRATKGWRCDVPEGAGTDDVESVGVGANEPRRHVPSPYAYLALRYLERARRALPDEAEVACSHAKAALAVGDEQPMQALAASVPARVSLAYSLGPDGQHLALEEFEQAIPMAPDDVEALNGYAYVAAGMSTRMLSDSPGELPDPDLLVRAESRVRRAMALSRDWSDLGLRTKPRATLGEVLLAQGRYHEAVDLLEQTLAELGPARNHVVFHRQRYDLSVAALCAADVDERAGLHQEARAMRDRALKARQEIQRSEHQRGLPNYSDPDGAPDALHLPSLCLHRRQIESAQWAAMTMRAQASTQVASHPVCGPQWVSAQVRGAAGEQLAFELWGGGLRRSYPLDDAGRVAPVVLNDDRRASHHHHFALLSRNGKPVSSRVWLSTQAASGTRACDANLIQLNFEVGPRR